MVGVCTYGGGLWHTWLDRDLTVAGRVIVKNDAEGKSAKSVLVHVPGPVLRIPSLCIHLQTAKEREALDLNAEKHLVPILCCTPQEDAGGSPTKKPRTSHHSSDFLSLVCYSSYQRERNKSELT